MLLFPALRRTAGAARAAGALARAAPTSAAMHIGVPRETKDGELRVGLHPEAVRKLVEDGHSVWVEASAGVGAGFHDEEYAEAGATVADQKEAWSKEFIVKAKELQHWEFDRPHKGQIFMNFQLMGISPPRLEAAQRSGAIFLANENIRFPDGRRPLLEPMSRISGRMAATIGSTLLQKYKGGSGVFMTPVAGCPPGQGLVVGAGVAGQEAALGLLEMGAVVTLRSRGQAGLDRAYEYMPERLRHNLTIKRIDEPGFEDDVINSDLLIGAVSVPGMETPKLISRELIGRRREGSAYVEVGVDQGGISETCHMRYFSDPMYIEEGQVHFCVSNLPAAFPRASTFALVEASLPYVRHIAERGVKEACEACPELMNGLVVGSLH